jgi:putative oxidoreductase
MKCPSWCNKNTGLLVIRIGLGVIFLAHGWAKLGNMDATIGFFGSLGFPAFLAWVVALVETLGGLAVLLGLWTRYAATLLAVIMLVVIVQVKGLKSFMGQGSYEFEFMLFMVSLGIAAMGSGKYSIMAKSCACTCHPGDKRCGVDGKCEGCGKM